MRFAALLLLCAGVLLAAAGCDSSNKHYFTQGVGTDLYTDEVAAQTALQDEYVAHICEQAGLASSNCGIDSFSPMTWSLFVQAGMNDIDRRCDAYLTWLDNVRRAEAPTLKQIADTQNASQLIMQASGVGAGPIAIVAAAFGLATNTFTNLTSRLILEVNRSTVQAVVLTRQKKFREDLLGNPAKRKPPVQIASKPAAIYALRSYLRLCMPMTIETEINNTIATFEGGGGAALDRREPMISAKSVGVAVRPTVIRDVNAPLKRVVAPAAPPVATRIGPFEARMSKKDMKSALDILGCAGPDLGPAGSTARRTLAKLLTENGKTSSDRITDDVFFTLRELKAQGKTGACNG